MEELQLHFLITEQLFLIDEQQPVAKVEVKNEIGSNTEKQIEEISPMSKTVEQVSISENVVNSIIKIQKLLVITEPLTIETNEMLQKLLAAIGLKTSDFEISQDTALIKNYNRAIIFGKSGNKTLYTINQYEGMEAMRSISLSELQNNVTEKRKLWTALLSWYGKSQIA
jgi:DNA polymerase III psi subunit